MADRPAKDWHGALRDSITAAHGLSGLIAGLAGGFDRTDQTLGIPPSTATEAEAQAFIEAHNPDWKVSAHHVAFTVWRLWRDIIRLQHFNPVWATMGDVLDQVRQVRRARGAAIKSAVRELRRRAAELERVEREALDG